MKMLTEKNKKDLKPLYYGEESLGLQNKAVVKFFTPWSNWTWWASEWDGNDLFFGLVSGHEVELGYFTLSELESVSGPYGLKIERDMHFEPTTLQELLDKHGGKRCS